MSTLMNLKVTKVAGGSAGQLIVFSLVGADANTLAARLQKERGDSVLELFVKNPDHGFVEGQELAMSLTVTGAAVTGTGTMGTEAAFSVKTNRPVPAPTNAKTQPVVVSSTAKPVTAPATVAPAPGSTGGTTSTLAPGAASSSAAAATTPAAPTEHERLVKAEGKLHTLAQQAEAAAEEVAGAASNAPVTTPAPATPAPAGSGTALVASPSTPSPAADSAPAAPAPTSSADPAPSAPAASS